MKITPIDIAQYYRAEHFRHYIKHECSISITADIDITVLWQYAKIHQLRIYPMLLWVISKAVNAIPECKFTIDTNGDLAMFERIDPAYVAWNSEKETIYCISTPYNEDYRLFYNNCIHDIETNKNGLMFPQGATPSNIFSVSASSELKFTSVTINVHKQPLAPIIVMGKVYEDNAKFYIPIATQVHHAACDMHHIALIHKNIYSAMEKLK